MGWWDNLVDITSFKHRRDQVVDVTSVKHSRDNLIHILALNIYFAVTSMLGT